MSRKFVLTDEEVKAIIEVTNLLDFAVANNCLHGMINASDAKHDLRVLDKLINRYSTG